MPKQTLFALAAALVLALAACAADAPALKFGVLSDVHLAETHFGEPGGGHSVRVFKTALERLRARSGPREDALRNLHPEEFPSGEPDRHLSFAVFHAAYPGEMQLEM